MNSPSPANQPIFALPPPSTGRTRRSWQRTLSIGGVIGIHIVLIILFAAKPFRGEDTEARSADVVYIASDLELPALPLVAPQGSEAAEAPADAETTEPLPEGTPRLVKSSTPDAARFARRAGIAPGKSARVILNVKVSESGRPRDIEVLTSSGSSKVDAQAVEYARALRWEPAMREGRKSSAEIELPVVLETPG